MCIVNEWNQSEKSTYHVIQTVWHYGKRENCADNKRSVIAMDFDGGERKDEQDFYGGKTTLQDIATMHINVML